jgi:diguanylate cyclase (GGDEF)-like protein
MAEGGEAVDTSAQIRSAARIVGLRHVDMPSLESVERRRLQLWLVMAVVLLGVSIAMAVLAVADPTSIHPWIDRRILGPGVVLLMAGFSAYAFEKEVHLRKLTRLLVDERVLSSALTNRVRELHVLLEAGKAVNSVLDLSQVLDRILAAATELLDADGGSIMLSEADHLVVVATSGIAAPAGAVVAVGESIAGEVARTREPLLVNGTVSADDFPGLRSERSAPNSAMSVPLVHRGELVGVLNVRAPGDRPYTEYDLRPLGLFAEQAAAAVANARLYRAARDRALHDPLTGLANRALFVDHLDTALRRRERHGGDVAVLFVDLDGFKAVNDGLGHLTGDALLVDVAGRLRSCCRASDVVARFGGDEFAVLLDDLDDGVGPTDIATRVVDELMLPFTIDGNAADVGLGASVGVAIARADEDSNALLRRADRAMYGAKERGGRCVYGPVHPTGSSTSPLASR